MRVDLTSKLKDNEDPIVIVGDMEVTLKSDASTVLQLMGVMRDDENNENNIEKMKKAQEILFSEEDSQKISKMPFYNWLPFMGHVVNLAANGELKDEEEETGESPIPATTLPTTGI
ncbi:MAG: hypothetical protein MR966_13415 [Lachnospiraceae bacterium]|nr:hypothetical protein [Lachnospiraceae bacterium]